MEHLVGWLASAAALVGAIVAVTHRNAVVGALFLVLNLLSLAVLYVLLEAPFVAAIQVIVYAGAIMVLFLFIIMLLDLRGEEGMHSGFLQRALAAVAGGLFLIFLGRAAVGGAAAPGAAAGAAAGGAVEAGAGSVERLAAALFSNYLIPFEAISVLLLIALAGAVVLAGRRSAAE